MKVFLVGLFMLVALGFHSQKALASIPVTDSGGLNIPTPTHFLPASQDFTQGNDVYILVAKCDNSSCNGAYQLNATTATVRIFVNASSFGSGFSFSILDGGSACSDEDAGTNVSSFTMSTLNYNSSYANTPNTDPWKVGSALKFPNNSTTLTSTQITNAGAGCSSYPIRVAGHGSEGGTGAYDGWYGFQFTTTLTSGTGWNSFKLQSDNAYFSYYAGSGSKFAVKAQPGSGRGNFRFGFAPNCSIKKPTTETLSWYDADAGVSNQGTNPVVTNLYDYNEMDGSETLTEIDVGTGNNVAGSHSITVQPGHLYAWEWDNINEGNGVQFQLPFDSFNAYKVLNFPDNCNPLPVYSCTVSPSGTDANLDPNQSVSVKVTFKNVGTSTWTTTDNPATQYRRIVDGTAYDPVTIPKNVAPGGSFTVTYAETAPSGDNASKQLQYEIWRSGVGPGNGSPCNLVLQTAPGQAACTADAADSNPAVGASDSVKVTVYNNGKSAWPSGYQVIQEYPGGNADSPRTLGNFPAGAHNYVTFNVTARTSRQTVTFKYILHTNGGKLLGSDPLCSTTISWGTSMVKAYCNKTTISGVSSTATYQLYHPAVVHSGYTYTAPNGPGYDPNNPNTWSWSTEPPNNAPDSNPNAVPPTQPSWAFSFTVQPAYYDPPKQITNVPIKITISGTGTGGDYYTTVPNDGGTHDIGSVFDMYGNTWPHIGDYSISMEFVSSGNSKNYQDQPGSNSGYGDYSHTDGGQSAPGTCLNWSCGSATIPDGEPGSSQKFVYTFNFTNQSNVGGDRASLSNGSGYHFRGFSTGGISAPGGNLSVSPGSLGGGSQSYSVSFTSTWLYSGTFSIDFYYGGNLMAGCSQSATATPATRPYFQVPNGSIATGGAFRATNNSCASSASGNPPYVTPIGTNQYYGDVRAFYSAPSSSRLTGAIGSKAQYYGDILGNIYYNSGSYVGFAGTPQTAGPTLGAIAATPTNAGNGGYLNTNSQNHCVNDLFTNTRINSSPPNLSGTTVSTSTQSGQYTLNGATFHGGTIGANQQITLYVNGNVTITGNMIYNQSGWDATKPKTIPYFMMIVKGNVYVSPAVTQLDGLYVAQPTSSTSGGIFHTCDTGGHFCTKQLVVNGAVIAQGVHLERAHGTLGIGVVNQEVATQPAEIFNYSPLMVLGVPYIAQTQNSPTYLEGLFSLPPVF